MFNTSCKRLPSILGARTDRGEFIYKRRRPGRCSDFTLGTAILYDTCMTLGEVVFMAYSTLELYGWIPYLFYLHRILREALAHWSLSIEALHDSVVIMCHSFYQNDMFKKCDSNLDPFRRVWLLYAQPLDRHNKL